MCCVINAVYHIWCTNAKYNISSYLLSTIPTPDMYTARRLIGRTCTQNKWRCIISVLFIHHIASPMDKDFATAASSALGTASVNIELVGGAAFVVVTWVRVYLYIMMIGDMEECEVVGRRLS